MQSGARARAECFWSALVSASRAARRLAPARQRAKAPRNARLQAFAFRPAYHTVIMCSMPRCDRGVGCFVCLSLRLWLVGVMRICSGISAGRNRPPNGPNPKKSPNVASRVVAVKPPDGGVPTIHLSTAHRHPLPHLTSLPPRFTGSATAHRVPVRCEVTP